MLSAPINNNLAILPGDLEFLQHVGSGAFGEVWKGRWRGRGGGITVAIKKVPVIKTNPRQQREVLMEVGIQYSHVLVSFTLSLSHSLTLYMLCSY